MLATTFELRDQALIAKAREEGREEEREQNKRKIVLAMAQRGFAYELIADLVELTLAEVQGIVENVAQPPIANL